MYKHILAQHNIWRRQEMLKSSLKPWEVLCIELKEPKYSFLTLLWKFALNIWLQREIREAQNWLFWERFPWRKSSLELFFPIALSCQIPVLFAELFFTSQPNCAGIEKQMSWQIFALLSSPPTCTSKVLSSRNVTEKTLFHVCGYEWPTRNFWTSVAPLGTGGSWVALKSAVNPPGCCDFPGSGNWRNTLFYSGCSGNFVSKAAPWKQVGSCLLVADTHSRSFWASLWCFSLAKTTLSFSSESTYTA